MMDFVDLDKVLDEFEEEEKAALSIVPGQELKPSGYIQFLEKHQAQEWDVVNTNNYPERGYTLERKVVKEPQNVSYDEPYDGFSQSKLDFIQNDKYSSLSPTGSDQVSSDELVITGTRVRGLKDHVDVKPRRGTIASKTTEMQTDALTPNSERELASLMFPKSDIHVDGHVNSMTLSEENNAVKASSDQNNSPIYASVDSTTLVQSNEAVTSSAPSSSSVLQTDYANDSKHMFSNYADTENSCNSRLKESHSDESQGERNQQIIGFDNASDKDLDEEEVNMYLSGLDGEYEGNFGLAHEQTNIHLSETNGLGLNLADELKDADLEKVVSQTISTVASNESGSEGNNQKVFSSSDASENSVVMDDDFDLSYKENPDIVADLGVRPKKMVNVSGVVNYTVLNSMMKEKSEIERVLDEKKMTSDNNTVTVYEKMMWSRMEIEDVLSEAIQNQQKGKYNESPQQFPGQNLPDFTQESAVMSVTSTSDSHISQQSLPASTSLTSSSVIGTNCNVEHSGHVSMNSDYVISSVSSAPESCNSLSYTGIGARPKDFSAIRKNRPNSLHGLSKVNLDISPTHKISDDISPSEGCAHLEDLNSSTTSVSTMHQMVKNSDDFKSSIQYQLNTSCSELEVKYIEDESKQRMHNNDSIPSVPQGILEVEKVLDETLSSGSMGTASSSIDASGTSSVTEDQIKDKTEDSPGTQKVIRPNVLNLPARPDFELAPRLDTEEDEMEQDVGLSGQPENAAALEPTTMLAEGAVAEMAEGETQAASQSLTPVIRRNLGEVAPFWIPDADAEACMTCNTKFTMWKRRHHCRACGKVLCSQCCSQKSLLRYMDNKEARVCIDCYLDLNTQAPAFEAPPRSPNPNNPSEYCSKVPPNQQASGYQGNPPTVMVPTGVLKGSGSQRKSGEPKQVMFSDGIRPGGDLTELDGPDQSRLHRRAARSARRAAQQPNQASARKIKEESQSRSPCLVPEQGLPPLYIIEGEIGHVEMDEDLNQIDYSDDYRSESGRGISFAVNKNLSVTVKVVNLDCCMNRVCWCFVSRGMASVGQSELVILLELTEEEMVDISIKPPRDIFMHYHNVYQEALKGSTIQDMGHTILHHSFLGSGEYGGFLYVRSTFQCLNKLPLPEPPFLFGILLQKWEAPWAKVFPIRLMLRLGAEFRYYPCPLIGVRNRKPVFYEIGHTIMNLLADFRNYQYFLTQIKGVKIHMKDKQTVITLPKNRYNEVMKVVRSSNEHVMAFGSSFSTVADSHLVCIQNEEGNYQTQAINIQNKPRLVTGASFVVFNGALKTSSGLRAKSSIVEDGVMVQVLPEAMANLKQALKNMTDHTIACGPLSMADPEETLELKWVESDKGVNVGVKSYIDGTSLEGVESVSVKSVADYVGENLAIRWTHLYFLRQDESHTSHFDPMDLTRLTEEIAGACCTALIKYLEDLRSQGQVKLGLRVNLMRDSVGYDIGSKGQSLQEKVLTDLDTRLVPIIHQASEEGIILELVFHILD